MTIYLLWHMPMPYLTDLFEIYIKCLTVFLLTIHSPWFSLLSKYLLFFQALNSHARVMTVHCFENVSFCYIGNFFTVSLHIFALRQFFIYIQICSNITCFVYAYYVAWMYEHSYHFHSLNNLLSFFIHIYGIEDPFICFRSLLLFTDTYLHHKSPYNIFYTELIYLLPLSCRSIQKS